MRLLRRSAGTRPTRLFFAADLHGSEPTFRKFLGAAGAYQADALVFGEAAGSREMKDPPAPPTFVVT